ncbi:MAG: sporulation-delaying protein SdpB family protein [Saonia sp.]
MNTNNIYGLCRSLIAFSLFITLISNDSSILFPAMGKLLEKPYLIGLSQISIFTIFKENIVLAKWICVGILILVIIGWRPRYTVLFHWWVAFSFFISCPVIDGGDQIAAILTFLIIPFGLTDKRKWHWKNKSDSINFYANVINYSFYCIIRIQASIIYFFAASEKLSVPEWKNGTVIYYWLNHPTFGMNDSFRLVMDPIIESPFVSILTWSVLILEVVLSMGLIADRKYRGYLLILGFTFHFLILVFHGLFTFFFYMTALLILYLKPLDRPFDFKIIKQSIHLIFLKGWVKNGKYKKIKE